MSGSPPPDQDICQVCTRYLGTQYLEDEDPDIEGDHVNFCEAFPLEIPEEILTGEHDHKTPFEGDNGLRFNPIAEA